ncbi:MAG: LacI family DNA-binding transcriptional regulator [Anaerolineaceae bacterium]|nr:LacI family DNA-binding transcriptional regulator [Anaerolineaceae bacterium]
MKRPTQVDVAKLAGVSRATVSYVLNDLTDGYVSITEETRQRVLKAVEQLGYQPDAMAQSLRSGTTNTIGLLIPDMHNPHYWQIAYGVEQEVRSKGFDVMLMSASLNPDHELHSVQTLARRRIDGLILLLTFFDHVHKEIEHLVQQRKPVVLIGTSPSKTDIARTSFKEGAVEVMKHLLELGHRRIGLIYGVGTVYPDQGTDRLIAYRQGLQSMGLTTDESLIQYCGTTIDEGYKAATNLIDQQLPPTAIIVINDMLAIGVMRAINERHLNIPDDVSIVSFDDIEVAAYLNPPLTTVRVDGEALGRAASQLIFKRLENPTLPPQEIFIPSQLIIRGTTGEVLHK